MTKVYVCEISNLIEEVKNDSNVMDTYFEKLGEARIEHILKNKKAEDRARSLGAALLLLFVLQKNGYLIEQLPDFSYVENGKPYLKQFAGLHFNLSHTKNIIACVISNAEVGIDVEHVREIKKLTVDRVFTKAEIELAKNMENGFVSLWTMKEACAKVQGKGLADILDGMEIIETENGKLVKKLNQDIRKTFCCKVVAEGKIQDCCHYPYYYSVCIKENAEQKDLSGNEIETTFLQWDKGAFAIVN